MSERRIPESSPEQGETATRALALRTLLPLLPQDPRRLGDYAPAKRMPGGNDDTMKFLAFPVDRPEGGPVVLKVLDRNAPPDIQARFRREVEAAERVVSPRAARLLATGEHDGYRFMVQEFAPGMPLSELLATSTSGHLSLADTHRLAVGLLEALRDVRDADVVHGDVKPSNVIIGNRRPMLVDFGASQVSGQNSWDVMGTPRFVSPEQRRGETLDWRSDIFCWALTVVRAATGSNAIDPDGVMDADSRETALQHGDVDLSRVYPSLRPALAAALRPDREARPTVERLLAMLEEGEGVTRTLDPLTQRMEPLVGVSVPLAADVTQLRGEDIRRLIRGYYDALLLRLGESVIDTILAAIITLLLAIPAALVLRILVDILRNTA